MTTTSPSDPPDSSCSPDPFEVEVMTVRCTEDVLALVPHLLGFHPEESVVMATFGSPHGAFHARVDLPLDDEGRRDAVEVLTQAVERNAAAQTMVLVYTDDSAAAARLCRMLVPAIQRAGADVIDAVRVGARHWWDAMDPDAAPVPFDVSAHPLSVQRIVDGSQVLPSRAAVADTLVGTHPDLTERLREAVAALGEQAATSESATWLLAWVGARLDRPETLGERDLARVLALARHDQMRVVVWTLLSRRTSQRMVELWRSVVRVAPPTLVSGPAALVALAAWLAGDGALAWCAVERSLEDDPETVDAQTVAGLLQGAVAPDVWVPPDPDEVPLLQAASPHSHVQDRAS